MRIDALHGHVGMLALMRAVLEAGDVFALEALIATPTDPTRGAHHLVMRIGDTAAALSLPEARWFADQMINQTHGPKAGDLECFGRLMLSILKEAPGPHGAH
jgi:hypothetical protein